MKRPTREQINAELELIKKSKVYSEEDFISKHIIITTLKWILGFDKTPPNQL